jgi:hypothetical protein
MNNSHSSDLCKEGFTSLMMASEEGHGGSVDIMNNVCVTSISCVIYVMY